MGLLSTIVQGYSPLINKALYGGNTGLNAGTWSINGVKLPEFNLTEKVFASDTPTQQVPPPTGDVQGDATTKTPYVNQFDLNPLAKTGGSTGSPTVQDPYKDVITSTGNEANASLQALQTEYDRNRSNLEGQLSQLGTDRSQGLSTLQSAVDEYGNLINTQKTDAENARAKQVQSAGSAARQTQAKSRNVLRALGILSSSAAGDILSRPMTEFAGQRADINQATQQRLQQLDDAFRQKTDEHVGLVKQLESQYAQLVGQIQSDLRFSDRERADAIAQANAAAQSRLSEIKMAQANWQNQINAAKNGLLTSQASLSNFTNPTADVNAITNTGLNTTQQYNPTRYQASIVQPDKDKLSGIYG